MKARALGVLLICLLATCRQALAEGEVYHGKLTSRNSWTGEDIIRSFQDVTDRIQDLDAQSAIGACGPQSILRGQAQNDRCIEKYREIYDKPVTDMRIVLGYKDDAHNTQDPYLRYALVAHLTGRCTNTARKRNDFACGFRSDPDNADLFYKNIVDPDGKPKLLKLTVVNSSYTVMDADNRGKYKPEQQEKTAEAREAFLEGLKEADVVLYDGHVRSGGGPDFAPPLLLPDGRRNYPWYKKNQPGLKDMLGALKESKNGGPKVLGIFGCYTQQKFYQVLRAEAPSTSFLMTRGYLWWNDEPDVILGVVNALIGQFCEPTFSKAMDNPAMDPGSRVYPLNFF